MSYTVLLFQTYLRKPILNFGNFLEQGSFVIQKKSQNNLYSVKLPPTFEQEIERSKETLVTRLRRTLGILNLRIKPFVAEDIIFTFSCLLLTRKPYFVYVENGLSLFNYDLRTATHPVARFLFSFLIARENCKKIIFMSKAAEKSLKATLRLSPGTQKILEQKSVQIYPAVDRKPASPKKFNGEVKLLFIGMLYIKGGMELVKAFRKIRIKYPEVSLTMVSAFNTIKSEDRKNIAASPGITLRDATLSEKEMDTLYASHHVLVHPTYRDSFPLVLVEAISWGMPLIATDQYGTTEVALDGYNGLVYPDHPLKNYDPVTYRPFERYSSPKNLYRDIFAFQKEGKLEKIVDFLYDAMETFITEPEKGEAFSENSLRLYNQEYDPQMLTKRLEQLFLEGIRK